MAMTTEEAMAFAEKMHSTEPHTETVAETNEEQSQKEQEVSPEVKSGSAEVKQDAETKAESLKSDSSNDAATTADSKISYAFAREKSKRKEMKKHYEQQIADLKKQLNERLSAKPAENDISALVDYKIDQERIKDTIANVESNMRNLDADDLQSENERRIANAWKDESDREQYRSLLESNGKMFLDALTKYDPDNVVLEYLDGQQDYPLLLKELMTNVDSLKSVFAHRDITGRLMALDILNRKLHQVKPSIAKVGRLVRNSANVSASRKDNNYWNNWLKNHPRH